MKAYSLVKKNLLSQGLLPLFFHPDPAVSIEVLRALYRAGIRITEYTNRGSEAPENYSKLLRVRDHEMPDLILGVGTIKETRTALKYLDLGADFLVSPNTDLDLIQYASVHGIFHLPGCMTPSEIAAAGNAGATFIKLFPGNILGPGFIGSIRDIFPELQFMPTGGVDPNSESISSWFAAGAKAVGMGSKLISKKLMDQGEYQQIENNTKQVLQILKKIQSNDF